ncbi:6-hydroxy-D-nicotine oxidase [Mycena kentingensis (nom. inval.)]|nr:6-hydroxy-D-nicotine oxidase [Mycena kentingensis (nom. inval.)]
MNQLQPPDRLSVLPMQSIQTFHFQHPNILVAFPGSAGFDDSHRVFDASNTAVPLAVARPKNATDVALLVKLAATAQVPFSPRVGGHDIVGRNIAADALLDLRALNSITVDESGLTATPKGLAACFGNVPWLGYVGFCTLGGYGALAGNFGLGVDQILGATVVTAEGGIVEADEELLKGIRGAGGNFGVIVELKIQVHKLKNVIFFFYGKIMFDTSDTAASFKNWVVDLAQLSAKEPIPDALNLQPVFVNSHTDTGRLLPS